MNANGTGAPLSSTSRPSMSARASWSWGRHDAGEPRAVAARECTCSLRRRSSFHGHARSVTSTLLGRRPSGTCRPDSMRPGGAELH